MKILVELGEIDFGNWRWNTNVSISLTICFHRKGHIHF